MKKKPTRGFVKMLVVVTVPVSETEECIAEADGKLNVLRTAAKRNGMILVRPQPGEVLEFQGNWSLLSPLQTVQEVLGGG